MQHLIIYLHIKEEYIVAEITNKRKLATVGYVEAILHKLQDWMPFKRKNGGILQDSKDENGEQTLQTTNTGEIALGKYNKSDISYEYYGLVNLNYKNKKNDKIGHIKYYYKDKLLYEEDLYLNKDIKFSLSKYMNSNGHNLIVCILLLIFSILFLIKILKVNT